MEGLYNKCKNCGRMKLMGFRCNICFYTDPDEPHDSLCMCIECIPTPKDIDPYASDSEQTESAENHHDLGGEAG